MIYSTAKGFERNGQTSKPCAAHQYPLPPRACGDCGMTEARMVILVVEMTSSEPKVGVFCCSCADKHAAYVQGKRWETPHKVPETLEVP